MPLNNNRRIRPGEIEEIASNDVQLATNQLSSEAVRNAIEQIVIMNQETLPNDIPPPPRGIEVSLRGDEYCIEHTDSGIRHFLIDSVITPGNVNEVFQRTYSELLDTVSRLHRNRQPIRMPLTRDIDSDEDCGNEDCNICHGDEAGQYCPSCNEHYEDDECPNCSDNTEPLWRSYQPKTDLIQNAKEGEIVKSVRPFGVELEIQCNRDKSRKLSIEIPRIIGVESDGSINGNGFEIQTPPASGDKAEGLIKEVCKAFLTHRAKVDRSCGYHVHIGMGEIDQLGDDWKVTKVLRDIWAFYMVFEDVIMSLMPENRRANQYCRQLRTDYHLQEILNAESSNQLERIWYRVTNNNVLRERKNEAKDSTRYRGINMHTLFSGRHLEVRFHSGTTNARKVLEWANLHCKVADLALKDLLGLNWQKLASEVDLENKTAAFFDILRLSEESEAYFRVRQAKFAKKVTSKESSKENIESAQSLLVTETEA